MIYMSKTFMAAVLLVACALLLQLKVGWGLWWATDIVLVALFAAALFLNATEVLFLAVAAAVFINWKPVASIELLLLIAFPLAVCVLRARWPFRPFAAVVICALAGALIFRGSVEREIFVMGGAARILSVIVFDIVAASGVFGILQIFHEEKTSRI